jgi:hypothetical protein
MLRDRFRKVGGVPYRPTGKPIRKPYSYKGTEIIMAWDSGKPSRTDRAPVWIAKPEPSAKPLLKLKRRRGPHALAKIASKAPAKLVKRFVSAEAFAASRKRQ